MIEWIETLTRVRRRLIVRLLFYILFNCCFIFWFVLFCVWCLLCVWFNILIDMFKKIFVCLLCVCSNLCCVCCLRYLKMILRMCLCFVRCLMWMNVSVCVWVWVWRMFLCLWCCWVWVGRCWWWCWLNAGRARRWRARAAARGRRREKRCWSGWNWFCLGCWK